MNFCNTIYFDLMLRVTHNTLCGQILGLFTKKSQVFRHYSCRYRNHSREKAFFGRRLTLKLQLAVVFLLGEAEILAGEIKTRKKTGKKPIPGQNSTKHSGNSDRLHAIRQKIASHQAADIYPPRMIPPASSEVISSAEKWNIPGRGGLFQEKNVPYRFLWSIQAKKIFAAAIWRSFHREKCPPSRLRVLFVSKTLKNAFFVSLRGQRQTTGGRG
ncbi:MAG: hypothetical protein QG657_1605 [Acidobacteriota bacterium]|nr:hypothetical protein [Acidobacteriota bacterium]